MPESEDELTLIANAAGGDAASLERLLFAYYDRLRGRLARRLPCDIRGALAAEDVLQQALTEAFLRISSFVPTDRKSFYRWLITIADHRLADAIKAARALKRGGGRAPANLNAAARFDSADELIDLLAGPVRSPSQNVARQEALAAIQIGLAALKDEYRQAIQLRYVQGLSAIEVARIMKKTSHAVHHLCHRGLKELHTVMGRSSQYLTRR